MGKLLDLIEGFALVLVAIGIVVWGLFQFNFWADDFKTTFLRIGDIKNFIVVSVFMFVLAFTLKKLLVWEVRSAFKVQRRKRVR